MEKAGDVPRERFSESASDGNDNSFSTAGFSPPSSNLLREVVYGTEQSCCAQAVVLGTERPYRGLTGGYR